MMEIVKEKWKEMSESSTISKLEQRMWTVVIGLAMALGGIWLQNQYQTTLRLQDQLAAYMQFVDDKYIEVFQFEHHANVLDKRLDRIEDKLDRLITDNKKESPHP